MIRHRAERLGTVEADTEKTTAKKAYRMYREYARYVKGGPFVDELGFTDDHVTDLKFEKFTPEELSEEVPA